MSFHHLPLEINAFLTYQSTIKSRNKDKTPSRTNSRKLSKKQYTETFERGLELLHCRSDDEDEYDDHKKEKVETAKLLFGKAVLDRSPNLYPGYMLLGHCPKLTSANPYRAYGALGDGRTTLVLGQPESGKSTTLRTAVESAMLGRTETNTGDERLGRVPGKKGLRTLVLSRAGHPSCGGVKLWNVPCEFADLVSGAGSSQGHNNKGSSRSFRKLTVLVPPEAYEFSRGLYQEAIATGRCAVRPLVFSVADLSPRHVALLMGFDEMPDGVSERMRDFLCEAASSPGSAGVRIGDPRRSGEKGWDYFGFRRKVDRFLNGDDVDVAHRTALERKLALFDGHVLEEIMEYDYDADENNNTTVPDFPTCSPSVLGHQSSETVLIDLRNPCIDVHTANALTTLTLSMWRTPSPTTATAVETTSGVLVLDDLDVYIDTLPNLRPLLQSLSRDDSTSVYMSATKPLKLGLFFVGAASTVVLHKMKPKLAGQVIEKRSSAAEASKIKKEVETLRNGEAVVWCENGRLYPLEKDESFGQRRMCRVRWRKPVTGSTSEKKN